MSDNGAIVFSAAVRATQARYGAAGVGDKIIARGWQSSLTDDLATFLAQVDSFYLGTSSASGRPYIQHRGGPKGFLQPLDDKTLAFADFRGNKQYISAGNLSENGQAFIFLMNYAAQTRIKIWGRAEVVDDDADLLGQLGDAAYDAVVERAIKFHIEAWDINCRQHITRRYTEPDIEKLVAGLQSRINELEAEIKDLKAAD